MMSSLDVTGNVTETSETDNAHHTLRAVSSAILDVLSSLPGKPSRPVDVMRALEINRKSAWQFATVASSDDPAKIASAMPGRQGFKIFLEQARKRGVADTTLEQGFEAFERFESLVHDQAGSRSEFEQTMIESRSSDRTLSYRKSAVLSNAHILGVRASAQIATSILNPSDKDPDRLDIALVGGLAKFEFQRPDISWRLGNVGALMKYDMDHPDRPTGLTILEPVFPSSVQAVDGTLVPLVEPYSTKPLPRFETKKTDRVTSFFFSPQPAHSSAKLDCYMAILAPAASLTYGNLNIDTTSYTQHSFPNWLSTPVDYYCFDLIVPQGLWKQLSPRHEAVHLFNTGFWDPIRGIEYFDRPHLRLPMDVQIQLVGTADMITNPPSVPKYTELIGATFEQLGWNPELFEVHRLLIKYPPTPIVSRVMFDRLFVS